LISTAVPSGNIIPLPPIPLRSAALQADSVDDSQTDGTITAYGHVVIEEKSGGGVHKFT